MTSLDCYMSLRDFSETLACFLELPWNLVRQFSRRRADFPLVIVFIEIED